MVDKKGNGHEILKEKLIKLQALADRGCKGEVENARMLIKKLCDKYGVKIEDIINENNALHRYRFKIWRKDMFKKLFTQCYANVTNNRKVKYWQIYRDVIEVEVTPLQYIDLKCLFDWHKANLCRDMEELQNNAISAYIHKHKLFANRPDDEKQEETDRISADEFVRLKKIFDIEKNLNDNKFHKMIEYKDNLQKDDWI